MYELASIFFSIVVVNFGFAPLANRFMDQQSFLLPPVSEPSSPDLYRRSNSDAILKLLHENKRLRSYSDSLVAAKQGCFSLFICVLVCGSCCLISINSHFRCFSLKVEGRAKFELYV